MTTFVFFWREIDEAENNAEYRFPASLFQMAFKILIFNKSLSHDR
jgi:hypothetical protein